MRADQAGTIIVCRANRRAPGSTMAQPIEQWITDIPPITRTWLAASIGTSLLVVSQPSARFYGIGLTRALQECEVISPVQLYFSWKAAVGNMQVSQARRM